jgi:hypothetical protein
VVLQHLNTYLRAVEVQRKLDDHQREPEEQGGELRAMLDEVKQRRAYRQSSPRRRGRPHRPLRRSRMPRIVPRSRFPTQGAP